MDHQALARPRARYSSSTTTTTTTSSTSTSTAKPSIGGGGIGVKERDRHYRCQDHYDRPSSSSHHNYEDVDPVSHHRRRRYRDEADWLPRSPSSAAAAAAASSSSTWSAARTSVPPPNNGSFMVQSRSLDPWSHSSSSSSRLPPPAHYDQRLPRSSFSGSGSERRRQDEEAGVGALSASLRHLSSTSYQGHLHSGNGGASVSVPSGYYISSSTASSSGITPTTTNSTSPSGLSTSSNSTGSGSCGSSSSLRTPPDLALLHHGALMRSGKEYEGNVAAFGVFPRRYLSIREIEERLKLLDSLGSNAPHIHTIPPTEPALLGSAAAKAKGNANESLHIAIANEPGKPKSSSNRDEAKLASIDATPSAMPAALGYPPSSTSTRPASKRRSDATHEPEGQAMEKKSKKSKTALGEGAAALRQTAKVPKKVRSRKESGSTRDYDTPSPSASPPPLSRRKFCESVQGADTSASTSSVPVKFRPNLLERDVPTLPLRAWTKEEFTRIANAYQARGRSLKHSGDHRVRSVPPSSSSSVRATIQRVANYEQTEAILLYVYAFWCEDHAAIATSSSGSGKVGCIAANWTSLSGLLHYVCANHEKSKDWALAGLCRLLEALVLKHVAAHEMRQLNVRLARTANRSTGTADSTTASGSGTVTGTGTSTDSPASQASPQTLDGQEPGNHTARTSQQDLSASLSDASSSLARIVADEERCARLLLTARVALSPVVLAKQFPKTWEYCLSTGLSMDLAQSARDLDPATMKPTYLAASGEVEDAEAEVESLQACWSYPLEVNAGANGAALLVPHLVNFSRALLREGSIRSGLQGYSIAQGLPSTP